MSPVGWALSPSPNAGQTNNDSNATSKPGAKESASPSSAARKPPQKEDTSPYSAANTDFGPSYKTPAAGLSITGSVGNPLGRPPGSSWGVSRMPLTHATPWGRAVGSSGGVERWGRAPARPCLQHPNLSLQSTASAATRSRGSATPPRVPLRAKWTPLDHPVARERDPTARSRSPGPLWLRSWPRFIYTLDSARPLFSLDINPAMC